MLAHFFTQSAQIQAIGIFAAVFLFALLAISLTARASRPVLEGVSASMMSPLGAIFALMTAFLAATEVQNNSDAVSAANAEARALSEARVAALALPPALGTPVQRDIDAYITAVVNNEWPHLLLVHSEEDPVSTQTVSYLLDALNLLQQASLPDPDDLQDAQAALRNALEARSRRLDVAIALTNRFEFYASLVLGLLLVSFIAVVHFQARRSQILAVAMASLAVATSLATIAVHDNPFAGARGVTAKNFAAAASAGPIPAVHARAS